MNVAPLEAGNRIITDMDRRLDELGRQFRETDMDITVYLNKLKELERQKRQVSQVTEKLASKQAGGVGNLGMALNQLSFGIQDAIVAQGSFSQKINAASNNIAQMALLMGGPAGVAAAAGLFATMLTLLGPELERLFTGSGNAKDSLEALRKQLEELARNPYKVAVDSSEIDEANAKLRDMEDAKKRGAEPGAMPADTRTAGQRAMAALGEFGGATETQGGKETVKQVLMEMLKEAPEFQAAKSALEATEVAYREAQQRFQLGQGNQADVAALRTQRDNALRAVQQFSGGAQTEVDLLMGRVEQGDASMIGRLSGIVRNNRGRFAAAGADPDRLLSGLAGADPAEIDRQRRLQAEAERAAIVDQQMTADRDRLRRANLAERDAFAGAMLGDARDQQAAQKRQVDLEAQTRKEATQRGAALIIEAIGPQIQAAMAGMNLNNPNDRATLLGRIMEEQNRRGIGGGQAAAEEALVKQMEVFRSAQAVNGAVGATMQAQIGAFDAVIQQNMATAVQFERMRQHYIQLMQRARGNGGGNFRPGL